MDQPAISEAPGQQIGRFKLLQEIGEGGFGVVYIRLTLGVYAHAELAEQTAAIAALLAPPGG